MTTIPIVTIRPRADTLYIVTDILIEHEGRHYGSRVPGAVADTPENRKYEAAAFMRRHGLEKA